tara:strand:+ start:2734 stop:3195 length:462 start_codon:yes stop_codon:yes gene_type:complete
MDLYDFINEDKVDSSVVSNSMIEQSNNDNHTSSINGNSNDTSSDEVNTNDNVNNEMNTDNDDTFIRRENLDILSTLTTDEIQIDINNFIYKISNKLNYYIDKDNIKKKINLQLIKIIKKNILQHKNLCIECQVDIGINNPRQLCGKTRCLNIN